MGGVGLKVILNENLGDKRGREELGISKSDKGSAERNLEERPSELTDKSGPPNIARSPADPLNWVPGSPKGGQAPANGVLEKLALHRTEAGVGFGEGLGSGFGLYRSEDERRRFSTDAPSASDD